MALPEGFQSWKKGVFPFCHVAVIRGMGRSWFFTAPHCVFLGEVCIRQKSVCLHRERAGLTLHGQVSQLMHHNTPAGLPVPGCLGDPLPPVGPHLLPVGPPVTHGIPLPSCLEKAFPGHSKPQETDAKRMQSTGRISHWSPQCWEHREPSKRRAGFPCGECLPPNPGSPGTSLQAGVTCKVLPVET